MQSRRSPHKYVYVPRWVPSVILVFCIFSVSIVYVQLGFSHKTCPSCEDKCTKEPPFVDHVEPFDKEQVTGKQNDTNKKKSLCLSLPRYYQVIPVERYPGLKCFIMASTMRLLVLSQPCDVVYVDSHNITIGKYVIPRQTPGKRCTRCYVADYLNVLTFVLFGRPELGIPPLAPMGALIMEDDVVICNSALPYLDKCFKGQYNCLLGRGALVDFFAGAYSKQPEPEKYSGKRYTHPDDIWKHPMLNKEIHVDRFINHTKRHVEAVHLSNHVGAISTLDHFHGTEYHCSLENSLAGSKVIINRVADVKQWKGIVGADVQQSDPGF